MDSIWVKIAGAAVAVVLVIVVLGRFTGNKPESGPPEKEKTFYDMADRDKQFEKAPKPAEPAPEPAQQQPPAETQAQPETAAEQPAQQPAEPAQQPQPTAQAPGVILPSAITKPTTLYFVPLDEAEEVAAEQLLPWATATRSIGRLPLMQYGNMVKTCRDILQRWPDSKYAFRAKQLLEDIYEVHGAQYKITPQEMDITPFLKAKRGAEPYTVEPVQK
ncbi:MAG: hypothetical protein ABFE01_17140 [Phycisphaerales bacterium]